MVVESPSLRWRPPAAARAAPPPPPKRQRQCTLHDVVRVRSAPLRAAVDPTRRTVVSLFDADGSALAPWAARGYTCIAVRHEPNPKKWKDAGAQPAGTVRQVRLLAGNRAGGRGRRHLPVARRQWGGRGVCVRFAAEPRLERCRRAPLEGQARQEPALPGRRPSRSSRRLATCSRGGTARTTSPTRRARSCASCGASPTRRTNRTNTAATSSRPTSNPLYPEFIPAQDAYSQQQGAVDGWRLPHARRQSRSIPSGSTSLSARKEAPRARTGGACSPVLYSNWNARGARASTPRGFAKALCHRLHCV